MRTGRPPSEIKRVRAEFRLTEETLAKLNLICFDPLNKKQLVLSKRNDIVENALTEYFAKYYPMKGDPK